MSRSPIDLRAVPSGGHGGGSHNAVFPLVIGILFVVVGTLNVVTPQLQWRLRRWQYRNGNALEPSDAALRVTRGVGGLLVVIGVVTAIVAAAKLA